MPLPRLHTVIHKNLPDQKPYTVINDGYLPHHFTTLGSARRYIRRYYAPHKDPTRFFVYPSRALTRYRRSVLKSLDIIAPNICLEARFVRLITALIRSSGPPHFTEAETHAVQSLGISEYMAGRFMIKHCHPEGEFFITEERVFLIKPW